MAQLVSKRDFPEFDVPIISTILDPGNPEQNIASIGGHPDGNE